MKQFGFECSMKDGGYGGNASAALAVV